MDKIKVYSTQSCSFSHRCPPEPEAYNRSTLLNYVKEPENRKKLITAVNSFAVLYNITSTSYRNFNKKKNAWKHITQEINSFYYC